MKYVPAPLIRAAQNFDNEAVDFVLLHFEGYIVNRCLSAYTDKYGNEHKFLDDDLQYQARKALLSAIGKFKFVDPPEDFVI